MSAEVQPDQTHSEEPKRDTQKWEYKFLTRVRGTKGSWTGVHQATEWDREDLEDQVKRLGEQGWELVNVVPRSSLSGDWLAGFTSDELWILKRSKGSSFVSTRSKESETDIQRFLPETRDTLEKKGYIIYLLRGKSIEEMWTESGEPAPDPLSQLEEWQSAQFWTEITPPREVAINPKRLFLPSSNDKSFKYHQRMIRDFSIEISEETKGTKGIIGEASNYVELALLHRKLTDEQLLFRDNEISYVVTKTPYGGRNGENLVEVGEDLKGVRCYEYNISLQGKYDTYLMPLIVAA